MKKIVFVFVLFVLSLASVQAFHIDVNEIDLNSRASHFNTELDKVYKIDTEDFGRKINHDQEIAVMARELVAISLSDASREEKKESLVDRLYVSQSNGFDTLTASMAIDLYLERIDNLKIEADRIKDIKTSRFNETDVMAFVYLDDCVTSQGTKDIVLAFWFKKENEYGLYYPWLTMEDDLSAYFSKVIAKEDEGDFIGGSYNKLSLNGEASEVSAETLKKLYEKNKNTAVQISGMTNNGLSVYGSGFFISEGVVVTSWSLFRQILTESNFLYVNDSMGEAYEVLGVVAAQSDYDVVVLKLNKIVGTRVLFGKAESLNATEKLFMINSQVNRTFSIKYGTYLEQENGRLKNLFLINESDVGAALFNQNGEVVAMHTGDLLNSDLSIANSTAYLQKLQDTLVKQGYEKIAYTNLESFKESYYVHVVDERVIYDVDEEVWEQYKEIGRLEETISLELVKSSYQDKILSLRYKNKADKMLDSIYLVSRFVEELAQQGFKLTYEDSNKKIYKNDTYKVIVKDNFNYLIILMMEI